MGFQIPWAVFWIPKPRIPGSTSKTFSKSGFYRPKFPRLQTSDSLTRSNGQRVQIPTVSFLGTKQQWRWAVMTVLLQIKTYDHKCYNEYHKLTFSKQLSKNASKESWEVTNDLCSINRLNICVLVNVWKNFVWELGRLFWNPTKKKRITKTCKNMKRPK